MSGTATVEVDAKHLKEMSESLQEGVKKMGETRTEMAKFNEQVDTLLKQQKDAEAKGVLRGEEIAGIHKQLAQLADKMVTMAANYTEFVHITRGQMKLIGQHSPGDGSGSNNGYMYRGPKSRGAIFESKQQAIELGMFFMATVKSDGPCKQAARKWLKEHASSLEYLPNIPRGFVEEFGEAFKQTMDRWAKRQDLSGQVTPGSVLVRPEFSNLLIRNVEEHGVFRREALIWPMASDVVHIPRRRGGVSVFWEGEGEAATTTDPDFDMVQATAKKMLMGHKLSNELSVDAAISVADILVFEFSLAFALEEDRIGFNGTGAGGNSPGFAGFVGVLGSARGGTFEPQEVVGTAGDNLTTEVDLLKLREMTGKLHTWARAGAKWYANRTVHADLDGIETTGNGPVIDYQGGRVITRMGYPVAEVEGMPVSPSAASTPVLALGDLRKGWVLGDRRGAEIETSEHYAFLNDQLTVRAKMRAAFKMLQGDAMVVYVTGTA